MKRILFILSAALFVACSGTIDPEDQNQQQQPEVEIPEEFTAPFTLSVDKSEVEADGKDFVTFSLKDAYDREMLGDKKALQSINITSDRGIRVPRMGTTATFISNGEYAFTATFKGVKSANTVVVTACNRAKYELYHKNVGLFKCTSVSCVACPNLGKILNGLEGEAADHSVVLSIHGNFSGRDPFSLYVGGNYGIPHTSPWLPVRRGRARRYNKCHRLFLHFGFVLSLFGSRKQYLRHVPSPRRQYDLLEGLSFQKPA